MQRDVKEQLLVLMDNIAKKLEITATIARAECNEEDAQKHCRGVDDVLDKVVKTKAFLLATRTDA